MLLLATVAVSIATIVPAFAQDDSRTTKKAPSLAAGETGNAEATVAGFAWYWRDQQQQKVTNPVDGTDVVTFELKNPYCPDTSPAGSPPEQVCNSGRLPVEVRAGDYARPHKISAINFDLSVVPPGSKIKKFEVKLYEATDEQSRSTQYNLDGKRLVACEIDGVFGDGEARLYRERPDFECKKDDASALRDSEKVGKGENEKELFFWRLDLTKQAQEWMKKEVFFTSIMLHPKEPRDPTPQDQAWQVVFAGPLEEKYGIASEIVYVSSGLPTVPPPPPPPPPPGTGVGGGSGSTDFGGGSTGTDFGSGSVTTDTGSSSSGDLPTGDSPTDSGAGDDTAAPTDAGGGDQELASAEETVPSGLPLYVWLAILAGLIGFSMVRSVVLEKNTGVRPDGVLAQIQRLNAQRRGTTPVAAEGTSAFSAMVAGLGALGSKITGGAGKLGQLVSRKKG
jgi:hypothetical protein